MICKGQWIFLLRDVPAFFQESVTATVDKARGLSRAFLPLNDRFHFFYLAGLLSVDRFCYWKLAWNFCLASSTFFSSAAGVG